MICDWRQPHALRLLATSLAYLARWRNVLETRAAWHDNRVNNFGRNIHQSRQEENERARADDI